MGFYQYLKLMRPHQWYKNALVFLPLMFGSVESFDAWLSVVISGLPVLTLGFGVLCAVSSAGYIFNDIVDEEKDAAHPEKRKRPLPSGQASRSNALVLAAILMVGGLAIAWLQDSAFLMMVVLYVINSQLYNWKLRNFAIVDVCVIAVGFIIRAIAGTFLINQPFTSWLVIGVFFVALVLGFGKRKNELQLLGEDAPMHKPVFTQYTETMLDHGIAMSATWVVMFYALYCYENYRTTLDTQPVMMTVPIVAGIVLRYIHLVYVGSDVGRKPHLAIKDKGILIGGILFIIVLIVTLFFYADIYNFVFNLFPPFFPPIIP
ncbi:MAG: Decaprenyl-phosphate phosphoribosyltransferase [Candidatus Thorarchaeota archaeon AB_25]|nr:MAG: Decaprenyl-phosphate phosphoribosyltransferase [Candidatus Thorarchaeota archaeon AB_25]